MGKIKFFLLNLKYHFTDDVKWVIVDTIGGLPCEYKIYDNSRLVGYWTYGAFDPSYPYRGQKND